MRLVLTGGGTGGHFYPALEVGRLARERGATLAYMGSLRGGEGEACARLGIPFQGFATKPIYNLRSVAGLRAVARQLLASLEAKKCLRGGCPDVVFSTGGYSSGPVVRAARSLGVPYVLHASDTVPGKAIRHFADGAAAMTCAFRGTQARYPKATRTGHPVRRELREAAMWRDERPLVLVVGGSGGARFLNEIVPAAAREIEGVRWLHATGKAQFDEFRHAAKGIEGYEIVPYLGGERMAEAYAQARVVVARSGSTLAEFAAFRLPSVLVPLPTSADDHQRFNALEFVEMGAATMVEQSGGDLAAAIRGWTEDPRRREASTRALVEWDVPDATARLASIIEDAARKNA